MENDVRKNNETEYFCITLTDKGIGVYASVKDCLVALASLIHHLKCSENISNDLIDAAIKVGLLNDEELSERANELAKEFLDKVMKGE